MAPAAPIITPITPRLILGITAFKLFSPLLHKTQLQFQMDFRLSASYRKSVSVITQARRYAPSFLRHLDRHNDALTTSHEKKRKKVVKRMRKGSQASCAPISRLGALVSLSLDIHTLADPASWQRQRVCSKSGDVGL